jgi:hypothetical protein
MSLLALSGTNSVSGGYEIDNSVKLDHDNAESFSRAQAQGNQQIWTFSTWLKRTQLSENSNEPYQNIWSAGSSTSNATHVYFRGDSSYPDNKLFFYMDNGGTQYFHGSTPQSFRDTSAWYHLVWAVDTTQATAANRSKIYINGEQITLDSVTYPTQNASTRVMDNGGDMYIGALAGNGGYRFNGYLAETVLVDGTQLAASDFGEYDSDSGIWIPIDVSSISTGTRGFYLDYSDASNLGNDADGSTVFTENYITSADQATDSPTNNFCTLNQLALDGSVGSSGNITQGATKATATEFDVFITFAPTFGVTSGKWYAEFEYEGSQADNLVGILDIDAVVAYNSRLGKAGAWSVGFYQSNGKLYVTANSGVTSIANWGASAANGDIISVAVDMDNHFVYFAKNGTYQNSGVPTSGATGTGGVAFDSNKTVGIGCSSYDQGGDEGQIFANYGGFTAGTISSAATDANGYGTFEYAPPSGYYALCTKNLAEYG